MRLCSFGTSKSHLQPAVHRHRRYCISSRSVMWSFFRPLCCCAGITRVCNLEGSPLITSLYSLIYSSHFSQNVTVHWAGIHPYPPPPFALEADASCNGCPHWSVALSLPIGADERAIISLQEVAATVTLSLCLSKPVSGTCRQALVWPSTTKFNTAACAFLKINMRHRA